jgi:tetratricopeptide (TPR) repeat protein
MQHRGSFGRSVVLALSLLSACAAAEPTGATSGGEPPRRGTLARFEPNGSPGALLTGWVAAQEGDFDYGASQLLKALADDPDDADLHRQAFLAALLAGRPEAAQLASEESGNPAAQLLLGDIDASRGNWDAAERHYATLPRQGITEILQSLLVAWAEFGAGRADSTLAQQHPYTDNERVRGVYTFHDALIADLAGRAADAGRLYAAAEREFGTPNLDLARAYASWQMRQGHAADARKTLATVNDMGDELAVSSGSLAGAIATRPVGSATDGIAEVYLAFGVLLRQQDTSDFANVMLRLALTLRPDFTAARLVAAEALEQAKHPEAALAMLAPVAGDDPLAPSVELRRAALQDRLGKTDEALRIFARLSAAYPDRPEPWIVQGDVLRGRHRYVEAAAALTRALALMGPPARTHWSIYYERGIAEERSHQWPAAEADFLKALELSPDQPSVLNYLGYSWTEQGHELGRAHDMIKRAAEQRPNDGAIVDSLGWVELRQGDVAGSVASLERAVEMEPEDATINGHLGDAYWAAGRRLEAQYQWRRALTLNPEPDDAAHFQARLHEAEQALGTGATTAKAQP